MPASDNDTIVADQGELEISKRRLGFRSVVPELPRLEISRQRFFFDRDNRPVADPTRRTAGEARWNPPVRWVVVDCRDRVVQFEFPKEIQLGNAEFDIRLDFDVTLDDPGRAASLMTASVRSEIDRPIRTRLQSAFGGFQATAGPDPDLELSAYESQVRNRIRDAFSSPVTSQHGFMTAVLRDAVVSADTASRAHHESLLATRRAGIIGRANEKNSLDIRDQRRESLAPHLANPLTRGNEVAYADLTPENIAAAIDRAEEGESVRREFAEKYLDRIESTRHLSAEERVKQFFGMVGNLEAPANDRHLPETEPRAELDSATEFKPREEGDW